MPRIRILSLLTTIAVLVIFGGVAILYARGYRLENEGITIAQKGLLVVNSDPTGAEIIVNGELRSATNNTLTLAPNTYDIRVQKEGFIPWEKRVQVKEEEVAVINAFLVANAPSLSAITFSGAFNPNINADRTRIAYGVPPDGPGFTSTTTEGQEIRKDGLWVIETGDRPLGLGRDPKQVTDGDLREATWEWSPNGRQILLTGQNGVFLLDASKFTPQKELVNIASSVERIREEWELEADNKLEGRLNTLPGELANTFKRYGEEVFFSPDETKILYRSNGSATIPEGIIASLPGSSTQGQSRNITFGNWYVFDIKEDKNFLVGQDGEIIYWLPNSLNLITPREDRVEILDLDGTNRRTVFTGGFIYPHVYPSNGNEKMLVLTNLGSSSENLYWLGLK